MNKYIFCTVLAALAASSASAVEVTCTPGKLHKLLEKSTLATELRVSGTMDASDFFFIDDEMKALRSLDLSAVTIAAYKGDRLRGLSEYPAATIPQGAFPASAITTLSLPATGSVTIGDFAFAGSAITTLSVPEAIKEIGQGAFSGCTALTSVKLSAARMGGYVFKGCSSLESVDLGSTVALGASDFADCRSLVAVNSSGSLQSIGASAFESCSTLRDFVFGSSLRSIGASAFAHSGLLSANLNACTSLSTLGDWAFAYDSELSSASLPGQLGSIGRGAFFDCSSLSTFTFPSACPSIADYTFKDARGISELTLPDGVESIGQYALKGAEGLSTITLPASLEYIGSHAMEGTHALTVLDASHLDYVPDLGDDVWAGVEKPAVRLDVADGMADDFLAADQWQDFNIRDINTGSDLASVVSETSLQGRFVGKELQIKATGSDISAVEVYNPAGLLLVAVRGDGEQLSIDTSHFDNNLYIIRCTLTEGTAATLKLAR
ncbi:MAG: leucine-rich repeat domain-containing protein [Muribaculaceae bacterium]|nr:leucine-rich repeat domain-containing protein [Muribaculaceae bacterium]